MTGAAQRVVEQLWGVRTVTRENPLAVADIDTATKQLLPADPDRLGILFINLGTGTVYVSWLEVVAATNGIRVSANGGHVYMSTPEDASLVTRAWFGMASADNQAFFLAETVAL